MSETGSEKSHKPTTDSPDNGESVFLAVGKLRRPHGLKGDVQMEIFTDFPERLHPGSTLYLGEAHTPLRIASVRQQDTLLLLRFEGYTNPEGAGELRNQILYVKTAEIPALPDGEFYHHQLLGLCLSDEQGQDLGIITDILETGANDVLVARLPSGKELLLPLIDQVVLKIDIEHGQVLVRLLPGLIE